ISQKDQKKGQVHPTASSEVLPDAFCNLPLQCLRSKVPSPDLREPFREDGPQNRKETREHLHVCTSPSTSVTGVPWLLPPDLIPPGPPRHRCPSPSSIS